MSHDDSSAPQRPSDRRFGLLFALILGALSVHGFYRGERLLVPVLAAVAALLLLALALARPALLAPLNGAWFRLGLLLGRIVSPIVLGLVFFVLLTPLALLARAFGRDELALRRRAGATSFWVPREPPGPPPDSFRHQF